MRFYVTLELSPTGFQVLSREEGTVLQNILYSSTSKYLAQIEFRRLVSNKNECYFKIIETNFNNGMYEATFETIDSSFKELLK